MRLGNEYHKNEYFNHTWWISSSFHLKWKGSERTIFPLWESKQSNIFGKLIALGDSYYYPQTIFPQKQVLSFLWFNYPANIIASRSFYRKLKSCLGKYNWHLNISWQGPLRCESIPKSTPCYQWKLLQNRDDGTQ